MKLKTQSLMNLLHKLTWNFIYLHLVSKPRTPNLHFTVLLVREMRRFGIEKRAIQKMDSVYIKLSYSGVYFGIDAWLGISELQGNIQISSVFIGQYVLQFYCSCYFLRFTVKAVCTLKLFISCFLCFTIVCCIDSCKCFQKNRSCLVTTTRIQKLYWKCIGFAVNWCSKWKLTAPSEQSTYTTRLQ
jgi:hypothetical protein